MQSVEAERLLLLLRYALNKVEQAACEEEIDYFSLFSLAARQGVAQTIQSGLCADPALPEELCAKVKKRNACWVHTLAVRDYYADQIGRVFLENNIRYIPLKGAVFAAYYPYPSMRESSDLDLLYDAKQTDLATLTRIMQSAGATKWEHGKEHSLFWFDHFLVEMHPTLFAINDVFDSYFSTVWERARLKEGTQYVLCVEDLYLYHLAHMAKHMLDGGIGIRSLCDLYVFALQEQPDQSYLDAVLPHLGLSDFSKNIDLLVRSAFSIDGELSDQQKRWLSYFLSGDMYGSAALRDVLRGKNAIDKKGKISCSYYFRRVFPKYRDMVWQFPFLKKMPILLPFFYIARWGRALLFRRKEVSSELKKIKGVDAKKLDKLLAFYAEIGIDTSLLK